MTMVVVAYKPVAQKKVYINQLNNILSCNLDRKTQSLCGLVPVMETKFSLVMQYVACSI